MDEIYTATNYFKDVFINENATLVFAIVLTLYVIGIPGMIKNIKRQRWLEKHANKKRRKGRRT